LLRADQGRIIAIVDERDAEMHWLTDFCFVIPTTLNVLTPLLTVTRCSCCRTT